MGIDPPPASGKFAPARGSKAIAAVSALASLGTIDGPDLDRNVLVRVTSRTMPRERGARFNTTEARQKQRAARKVRRARRKRTGFR